MGGIISRIRGNSPNQIGESSLCSSGLKQVIEEIQYAGVESCNIILGIDFTRSNEWTGKLCLHGRSLHDVSHGPNPYQEAISMIKKTLSRFDEDNDIPCYGFGDVTTHDKEVFCFNPHNRPCAGFDEVLQRYEQLLPNIKFSGPTSFAPVIDMAIDIVANNGNQFHILIIIADGQVAGSGDEEMFHCSVQAQDTISAIARASYHPLSIILVGVGDGPWNSVENYVSGQRTFDNFQFINFTEIMSKDIPITEKENEFALTALGKIPYQFQSSNVLRSSPIVIPQKNPLPPPESLSEAAHFGHESYTSSANSHS